MSSFKNKNVLITGGAAGIGKLMGLECLKEGAASLTIWDVNEAGLAATTAEFQAKGYKIHPYKVDLSKLKEITDTAEKTKREVGTIDILFNNAGVVVGKNFAEHTHEDIEFTISINVSAVMHTALAFIDDMIQQGSGHIINISSAAGLISNPKMSVYAGSKWAVMGWSESLRIELEKLSPDLHVTTVNPSYIKTGMFDGANINPLVPLLEPEYVATEIIKAVKENEIILRMPLMVNALPVIRALLPTRVFDFVVGDMLNVYDSMANFKGHAIGKK